MVNIISTTMVKPSSSTPLNKRNLKLSLLDQLFSKYGSMLYCYDTPTHESFTTLSLQKSLSKTLDLFYPFAGQINHDLTSIECNDHGVSFLEAESASTLSDYLQNPDPETTSKLLPSSDPRKKAVLLVQLTVFSCGGIAIGLHVFHKVADGYSVSQFAKTWAAVSAGKHDVAPPVFPGTEVFPPLVSPIKRNAPTPSQSLLRSRRFFFDTTKLADLKKTIRGNGGLDFTPSTLEAVSSLLFKCVAAASGDGALLQMVNVRSRLTPSLPDNCIGNFAWPLIVSSRESGLPTELHKIVTFIRKGLSKFFGDCKEDKLRGEALVSMISCFVDEEAELAMSGKCLNWVSTLSSLRLYETDFGWGEPVWVTAPLFIDRFFPIMHTKSGKEIEVWATLEETVMVKFESNEELLAFVSVDDPKNNATGHCCQ